MTEMNLCMGCMEHTRETSLCPRCGWEFGTPARLPLHLSPGSLLHQRYIIGKVIGHGGFGITYIAYDTLLHVKLAVKEYLPQSISTRYPGETRVTVFNDSNYKEHFQYGLERFLEEARVLALFAEDPAIVSVHDYFEANGTGYLVMKYAEGQDLKVLLNSTGDRLSLEQTLAYILPVMSALDSVHKAGLIHRDISPDNIFITSQGQVKLLDFGAARYALGEKSRSISVILKAGYAPEEQYRSKGVQGPWTDVYAVGATIYRCLTGTVPPESLDRCDQDLLIPPSRVIGSINSAIDTVLLKALAIRAQDRYQTIQEFAWALERVQAAARPVILQATAGKEAEKGSKAQMPAPNGREQKAASPAPASSDLSPTVPGNIPVNRGVPSTVPQGVAPVVKPQQQSQDRNVAGYVSEEATQRIIPMNSRGVSPSSVESDQGKKPPGVNPRKMTSVKKVLAAAAILAIVAGGGIFALMNQGKAIDTETSKPVSVSAPANQDDNSGKNQGESGTPAGEADQPASPETKTAPAPESIPATNPQPSYNTDDDNNDTSSGNNNSDSYNYVEPDQPDGNYNNDNNYSEPESYDQAQPVEVPSGEPSAPPAESYDFR